MDDMALPNEEIYPDEDIGNHCVTRSLREGNGSGPEKGRYCPGIRSSDGWQMDGSRQAGMLPVEEALAYDIYNVDDLCFPQQRGQPEANECQHEYVIQDKVRRNL